MFSHGPVSNLSDLPIAGAVYGIYSSAGDLLYIGRTANLRQRITSHPVRRSGHVFRWLEALDAKSRASIEANLLLECKPPLNRYIPKPKPEKMFSVRIRKSTQRKLAHIRARLVLADTSARKLSFADVIKMAVEAMISSGAECATESAQ